MHRLRGWDGTRGATHGGMHSSWQLPWPILCLILHFVFSIACRPLLFQCRGWINYCFEQAKLIPLLFNKSPKGQ